MAIELETIQAENLAHKLKNWKLNPAKKQHWQIQNNRIITVQKDAFSYPFISTYLGEVFERMTAELQIESKKSLAENHYCQIKEALHYLDSLEEQSKNVFKKWKDSHSSLYHKFNRSIRGSLHKTHRSMLKTIEALKPRLYCCIDKKSIPYNDPLRKALSNISLVFKAEEVQQKLDKIAKILEVENHNSHSKQKLLTSTSFSYIETKTNPCGRFLSSSAFNPGKETFYQDDSFQKLIKLKGSNYQIQCESFGLFTANDSFTSYPENSPQRFCRLKAPKILLSSFEDLKTSLLAQDSRSLFFNLLKRSFLSLNQALKSSFDNAYCSGAITLIWQEELWLASLDGMQVNLYTKAESKELSIKIKTGKRKVSFKEALHRPKVSRTSLPLEPSFVVIANKKLYDALNPEQVRHTIFELKAQKKPLSEISRILASIPGKGQGPRRVSIQIIEIPSQGERVKQAKKKLNCR